MTDQNQQTPQAESKPTPRAYAEDGLPETFTEDDLAGLDDSERAAILAEQQADIEAEQQNEPEPAKQEAKPEPEPEPPKATMPDLSEQKATVDAQKQTIATLKQQLLDGEISDADFQRQHDEALDRLVTARAEIVAAEKQYDQAQQQVQQTIADKWYAEVDGYMDKNPVLRDTRIIGIFDSALKALNSSPAYADWTSERKIRHAHRMTMVEAEGRDLIDPNAAQQQAPTVQSQQEQPKREVRTDDRMGVPTLGGVSQSDRNGVDDSAYAAVDRAIEEDYQLGEAAFARLSPEDQERYLMGA